LAADARRLTLAEAEQIALRSNPQIGGAALRTLAAAQEVPQIRSALYPTLSGNLTGVGAPTDTRLGAGAINNPIIYSRLATGVTATQLITDFGRTGALAAGAHLQAQSESEREKETREQVLLSVNRAYIAGLRAQAVVAVAEQTIAARQRIADHAKALAAAKLKSELDVRFAEVAVGEARLLLETARNERSAANADLSYALGYPSQQTFELVDEPPKELPSTNPDTLIAEALRQRPELAAARYDLEAAGKQVEAEKKLRWPTLAAVANVGVVPAGFENIARSPYAAAGVNIGLPVLNGRLFSARRAEAEYREGVSRKRLEQISYEVARDVSVSLLSAQSASHRMGLSARLVEQAGVALDLARARYDLGLSSIVELSQAQLAQTSAEIQNLNARFDYQLQRAILAYHLGELR
jgi:outer membrane protein